MAIILQFPTQYPPHQWYVRQKIARLSKELNMDLESFPWEKIDPEFTASWYELSDVTLHRILNALYTQRLEKQYARICQRKAAQWKEAQPPTQPVRRAVIISFPTPPEALVRIQERAALQQQQKTRAKAADKAVKAAPKETVERTIHKKMLAKVHIAVNDLKRMLPEFNDETYRFILEMKFDVSSSKDLTSAQLHELLLHFQNLGWQQKQSGTTHSRKRKDVPLLAHDPTGLGREAQMRKIQALLLEKGNVEGREVSMNYALSILKRQTGGTVTSFEDALPKQLQGVIAALSQDAIRKGRRTK